MENIVFFVLVTSLLMIHGIIQIWNLMMKKLQ